MLSFVTSIALGVALLVALPFLAHRLRRRRAEPLLFAPTVLVPAAKPEARRRAHLEHKPLFAVRALAILALALLGATPLVRCSRVALQRSSGASVAMAIIVDDSMSMRARAAGGARFARAKKGAAELVSSLGEGDAVGIVLGGRPARVTLAATTDLGAAIDVVDHLVESDRGTDLDSAIELGRQLIASLPQVDKRIVLFSDLADGKADQRPLGEGLDVPLWVPLPEIRGEAKDCAIVAADRMGTRLRVQVACSEGTRPEGREISVMDGKKELLRVAAPPSGGEAEITLAPDPPPELTVVLAGDDAIGINDRAPVVVEAGPGSIGVVAEIADQALATGGPPVVEQALGALRLPTPIRPIPQVPDVEDDYASLSGLVVDDPPGFTPEQRRALLAFAERGGLLLIALGPRASSAPLGASFEPLFRHATSWQPSPAKGAAAQTKALWAHDTVSTLADLEPSGRTRFAPEDEEALDSLVAWSDGPPLLARKVVGRGEVWFSTLPFSVAVSDFPLRPGFLSALDAWAAEVSARASPRRTEAGSVWTFAGANAVSATGPAGPIAAEHDRVGLRLVPPVIGSYTVLVDGRKELRVAAPSATELQFRPRGVAERSAGESKTAPTPPLDVSWMVALVLLMLLTGEMVIRVALGSKQPADA